MPEELWMEVHNIIQEAEIKIIPKKKNSKRAKLLSGETLQTAEKKGAKGKGEKEKYTQLNAEFQRIARRDKKAVLSDQCKEIEDNRMGKTRDHFHENDRYQRNVSCKNELPKGQKSCELTRSIRY